MSIRAISWVWENGPDDRGELLVLLALADFCDGAGSCWPSVPTIAKKTRFGERGVRKVLRRLEDGGWLKIEPGGGRGASNLYTLRIGGSEPAPAEVRGDHAPKRATSPGTLASPARGPTPERGDAEPCPREPETLNGGSAKPLEPSRTTCSPPRFAEFWETYPRTRDEAKSRQLFDEAVQGGANPDWIIASAKRYQDEQRGNPERYMQFSDNWLAKKRWEDHPERQPVENSDARSEIRKMFAEKIRDGKYVAPSAVSIREACEMLAEGLVTPEQLRAARIDS